MHKTLPRQKAPKYSNASAQAAEAWFQSKLLCSNVWSAVVTRILGRSAGNGTLRGRSGLGSNQEQQSRRLVWMLERWWRWTAGLVGLNGWFGTWEQSWRRVDGWWGCGRCWGGCGGTGCSGCGGLECTTSCGRMPSAGGLRPQGQLDAQKTRAAIKPSATT